MPPQKRSPSPSATSRSSRNSWHAADPSPLRSHSITELLHDPRASSAAITVPPPPLPTDPLPQPSSINEFTDYLGSIAAPHAAFLAARDASARASSSPTPLNTAIPGAYFSTDFCVADSPDLTALSTPATTTVLDTDPDVVALRAILGARCSRLEAQMHDAMSTAEPEISAAVREASALRAALASTRATAADVAESTSAVAEAVAADAPATAALGARRDNAVILRAAIRRAGRVRTAAEDAHLLVDAGEFPDAMRAVRLGRRALAAKGEELAGVRAVEGARASLGRAVERIDRGLRDSIRLLISADLDNVATGEERTGKAGKDECGGGRSTPRKEVRDLTRLVARLGTSALAHRSFLEDIRKGLERNLHSVQSVDIAANLARAAARKASLVHAVFTVEEGKINVANGRKDVSLGSAGAKVSAVPRDRSRGVDQENYDEREDSLEEDVEEEEADEDEDADAVAKKLTEDRQRNEDNLRELYEAILDLMCGVLDRLFGVLDPTSCEFIVLVDTSTIDEANFFDEAKGAVRFGEAMRTVDGLVHDIAQIMLPAIKSKDDGENGAATNGGARHGTRVNALRSKISERSLAFVNALAKTHTDALTSALHAEKWVEVKVPLGVLRLVACLTGDSLPSLEEETPSDASNAGPRRYSSAVPIHDERYKTVSAGLRYVRSICAFALFVDKLPFAASEAARRGVELSRAFNSLSGRAILGASALQWAGLRSITARHLALASRTVALAVGLAPHVSTPLQNAVSEKQIAVVGSLMMQAEKDMRDHHAQLLAKVMFIMMERLAVHEESLTTLPWKKPLEMNRFEIPSTYAATLSKEATVLHRILWSILPSSEVVDIFRKVFKAYGSHLSDAYAELDEVRPWVYQRVMADVALLHERLSMLEVAKLDPTHFEPIEDLYQRFYVKHKNAEQLLSKPAASTEPLERDETNADVSRAPPSTPTPPLPQGSLAKEKANLDGIRPSKSRMLDARFSHSPPISQSPQRIGGVSDARMLQSLPNLLPPSLSAMNVFGKTKSSARPVAAQDGPTSVAASDELSTKLESCDAEEQSLSSPLPSPKRPEQTGADQGIAHSPVGDIGQNGTRASLQAPSRTDVIPENVVEGDLLGPLVPSSKMSCTAKASSELNETSGTRKRASLGESPNLKPQFLAPPHVQNVKSTPGIMEGAKPAVSILEFSSGASKATSHHLFGGAEDSVAAAVDSSTQTVPPHAADDLLGSLEPLVKASSREQPPAPAHAVLSQDLMGSRVDRADKK